MLKAEQILQERYQLQQQLGQNAGRQTWLALDVKASQTCRGSASVPAFVIVKLLAFNPQMHWDELKLFEREAQVLKQLKHPRIPQYGDYFAVERDAGNGLPWFGLVQEYIPGNSIQQLLKQGKRFTEEESRKIAKEILEILIYLHELSPPVLHRDIKPSNLILGDDGQVYLVDFGAVQDRATAEGVTFTVVGTSGYAPPEQLWGRAVAASDLYAMGATLIHLLTGIAPADLPQRQMRIQFADKVMLSSNFAQWLAKLTEPSWERRFSTAKQALLALQASQYKRYASNKTRKSTSQVSFSYRLVALILLQLIVVGVTAWYLMLLIEPTFLHEADIKRAEEMNLAVAKQDVLLMNSAQETYHQKNQVFSNSLGAGDPGFLTQTETYNYSSEQNSSAVFHYAVPRKDNLKGYVGAVFVIPEENHASRNLDSKLASILCETNYSGKTKPNKPTYKDGVLACTIGTKKIER